MRQKLIIHIVYFTVFTLVMGIIIVSAGTVGTLTTFQPNTVAKSSEVNGNFTAIANAVDDNFSRLPMMWAQKDVDMASSSGFNVTMTEINSLIINAPSDGLIVISGNVYLENGSGGALNLYLVPLVDGSKVPDQVFSAPGSNDFAASFSAANTGPAAQVTLSYTLAVPITAGTHTVSQDAGPLPPSTATFAYNKNYLTVVFYPDSQAIVTDAPQDGDFGVL